VTADTSAGEPTADQPLSGETQTAFEWKPLWSTIASCVAAGGLCLAAGFAAAEAQGRLAFPVIYAYAGAVFLVVVGLASYWTEAALDGQLPPRPRQKPIDPHLSGAGVISLLLIAAGIVLLARWAGESQSLNREIQSHWGVYITFGLAAAFLSAALAPILDLERRTAGFAKPLDTLLRPLARLVSFLDSVLVLVVAGLAGAGRTNLLLRYLLLAMTIAPCGVLGFLAPPPWGLIPIAWGFLVVIAVSRRWQNASAATPGPLHRNTGIPQTQSVA
jgi:hypothetical protein